MPPFPSLSLLYLLLTGEASAGLEYFSQELKARQSSRQRANLEYVAEWEEEDEERGPKDVVRAWACARLCVKGPGSAPGYR